jgi:hypothetical protein
MRRWEDGWRSLGLTPPPSVDHEWVAAATARLARPVVLVGEATDLAERIASAAPAAPVLAVEPGD